MASGTSRSGQVGWHWYLRYVLRDVACRVLGWGCVLSAVQVQISEGVVIAVPGALPRPLFPASQMLFQGLSVCRSLLDPDLDLAPCLACVGRLGKLDFDGPGLPHYLSSFARGQTRRNEHCMRCVARKEPHGLGWVGLGWTCALVAFRLRLQATSCQPSLAGWLAGSLYLSLVSWNPADLI